MSDLRSKVKLLSSQSLPVVLMATIVMPAVLGAVIGLVLGCSGPFYWALLAISAVGGVVAGFEHVTPVAGFCRGLCGATFFTAGLLVAHTVSGWPALVLLPKPVWILFIINVIVGALLGAIGGWARQRPANPKQQKGLDISA